MEFKRRPCNHRSLLNIIYVGLYVRLWLGLFWSRIALSGLHLTDGRHWHLDLVRLEVAQGMYCWLVTEDAGRRGIEPVEEALQLQPHS